jgi:hypothetical protein
MTKWSFFVTLALWSPYFDHATLRGEDLCAAEKAWSVGGAARKGTASDSERFRPEAHRNLGRSDIRLVRCR